MCNNVASKTNSRIVLWDNSKFILIFFSCAWAYYGYIFRGAF